MTSKGLKIAKVIEKQFPGFLSKELLEYNISAQQMIEKKFTGVDYSGRVWLDGKSVTVKKYWNKGDLPLSKEHIIKEYRLEIFNKMMFNPEKYKEYINLTENDVINLLHEKYSNLREQNIALNHSVC